MKKEFNYLTKELIESFSQTDLYQQRSAYDVVNAATREVFEATAVCINMYVVTDEDNEEHYLLMLGTAGESELSKDVQINEETLTEVAYENAIINPRATMIFDLYPSDEFIDGMLHTALTEMNVPEIKEFQ